MYGYYFYNDHSVQFQFLLFFDKHSAQAIIPCGIYKSRVAGLPAAAHFFANDESWGVKTTN